jgi:hypothetical protein
VFGQPVACDLAALNRVLWLACTVPARDDHLTSQLLASSGVVWWWGGPGQYWSTKQGHLEKKAMLTAVLRKHWKHCEICLSQYSSDPGE